MELVSGYGNAENCWCGRSFSGPGPLKKHQRACRQRNEKLSGALATAKELWVERKRRRIESAAGSNGSENGQSSQVPDYSLSTAEDPGPTMVLYEADSNRMIHTPGQIGVITRTVEPLAENDHRSLAERRVRREIQLPTRFRDTLPQPLPFLPPDPRISLEQQPASPSTSLQSEPLSRSRSSSQSRVSSVLENFRTTRNTFGLFRQYLSSELPSHDPEEHLNLNDLSDGAAAADAGAHQKFEHPFGPFPNKSSFLLGDWYWNGGAQKSRESFRKLLSVVGSPEFRPEDVRHTQWNKIDVMLARNDFERKDGRDGEEAEWMDEDAGWKRTPINISVPFHGRTKNPGPQNFLVGHLYHRSLISVVREKLANARDNDHFHYEPFELFWRPSETHPDVRVHGELYTSPAFHDAHREVQELPGEPGCNLPRVAVTMMFSSDATHLTSFGTAKLWPCYLFFGNESKYRRCRPTCHLCNHVAYFQALPDAFKDFVSQKMRGSGQALMTHCRRELLQAQWEVLLDGEFLTAYEHGIVVECCDSITRRFYPRILTYSADYKDKIIVACIRDLGHCPCPRCLIPLSRVHNMGMVLDMKQRRTLARVDDAGRRRKVDTARDIIYRQNYAVDSEHVELQLKEQSLVPTSNAFSQKLAAFGFNLFLMLVVDIMHEFELGVWKALFIHLLRMLNSLDKKLLNELDRRFRQVPTFGGDTIRRFSSNISEMKKLAARDFENILQCAIPVFDGLFPEPHNTTILELLFICAHWHALAKLHMQTDCTLTIFDGTTVDLGADFRKFAYKTCPEFDTRELNREMEVRERRQQKRTENLGSGEAAPNTSSTVEDSTPTGPQPKKFNLQTFKYHSLGDYPSTIRQFGTTDSYSTEPGELEHRTSKARYKRTDRKQFVKQLTQIERRENRLRRIKEKIAIAGLCPDEPVPKTPQEHHHIGVSQNEYDHIGTFLQKNSGDPAIKNFLPKLKQHLLACILSTLQGQLEDNDALHDQANRSPGSVLFKHDRLYRHNIIRVNYTTYDVRRSQDVLNASTSHCNFMVLDNSSDRNSHTHPFRYARVLGVYHANVVYIGPGMTDYQPRRMEFLWVRWYQHMNMDTAGWATRKLDRVQFPSVTDEDSFGFIDPSDILRGCHIIPAFAMGKCHVESKGISPSARLPAFATGTRHIKGRGLSLLARDSLDWGGYYVNRFVDRDMVMRYHYGLGVGHTYAHHSASSGFEQSAADRSQECNTTDDSDSESNQEMFDCEGKGSDSENSVDLELWDEDDDEGEEENPENGDSDEDLGDEEILAMDMY